MQTTLPQLFQFLVTVHPSVSGPGSPVHLPDPSVSRGAGGDDRRDPPRRVWSPQEETPAQTGALRLAPERGSQFLVRRERPGEGGRKGRRSSSEGQSRIRGPVYTSAAQVG